MSHRSVTKGAAVAAAVMGLFLSAGCSGSEEDDTTADVQPVKCLGGNECAGMSECAGGPTSNECKGLNECMGMGWAYTDSEAECEAAGGMVAS
jgi:uncharacterized membrane protein